MGIRLGTAGKTEAGLDGPSLNSFSISAILGSGILSMPEVMRVKADEGCLFDESVPVEKIDRLLLFKRSETTRWQSA